jgi:UDP-N-acetylglucosamine acyltransferase
MVSGNRAEANGLNLEGLKRAGFSSDTIAALRKAYKIIYRSGNTLEQAVAQLQPMADDCAEIGVMLTFINSVSRGIVR